MAFTPTAGGSWDDARGQQYRFDIGTSDKASGTYYRFGGTNQWMTYDQFWKEVKTLQDRVRQQIDIESKQALVPKPVTPREPDDDGQGEPPSMRIAPIAVNQKQTAQNVVNSTTSSLTDSIPRPRTAQATPSPVSRFKMNKTKGRFTIGI